ncbi:MAG: M24 family metallopeptidase [Acidobacteria bacterium]|nr:M24 family metallopeptidase [Acidobacteriota bacterium]
MNMEAIQLALRDEGIPAWLFCDFHRRDHVARTLLDLPKGDWMTRRWYYLVPAEGAPVKLLHRIESDQLAALPGTVRVYRGWVELQERLREMLAPYGTIAMQYSPLNQLPSVSMADAGTVELVRSFGHEVISSGNLVQRCDSRWSAAALELHLEAGRAVDQIVRETFAKIGKSITRDGAFTEHQAQQWMAERLARHGLVSDSPPIVAANAHSGIPHYAPQAAGSSSIRAGDFVLLDVWAKCDKPGAVYYDVTWTGFAGPQPPEQIETVFAIVRQARDAAVAAVDEAMRAGQVIRGYEVDRAARSVIEAAGYGDYFVHRTGHSIGQSVHANGANMDDLETHDERPVIPGTCFSIEPGIYLPEFGVRSELDVYVEPRAARITGAVQNEIVRICIEP